jgi:hypothetical protein
VAERLCTYIREVLGISASTMAILTEVLVVLLSSQFGIPMELDRLNKQKPTVIFA